MLKICSVLAAEGRQEKEVRKVEEMQMTAGESKAVILLITYMETFENKELCTSMQITLKISLVKCKGWTDIC